MDMKLMKIQAYVLDITSSIMELLLALEQDPDDSEVASAERCTSSIE